ncbi:efflux RND transporter permease subunit [Pseudoalteromonas rubra]|nr:MMPL family transporter [Pseudoalteromonas rubra]
MALVLSFIMISGVRFLQADFTYKAFFSEGNPHRATIEDFEKQFSNDDSIVLLIKSPSGIFDQESATLITQLTEEMWKVPDIIRVDSLSNYRWVHAQEDDIIVEPLIPEQGPYSQALLDERKQVALTDEIIPDFLVDASAQTTMIVGYVRPTFEQPVMPEPIVQAVRKLVEQYQSGDHEIHITGRMAIMQGMKESSQADTKSRLPLVLGVIILVLAFRFKHPVGVMPVIPVIILSVIATMGLAGWTGIKISNITAMIPQFIIAICVADAVHILTSYFSYRRKNYANKLAVQTALDENVVPTLLTTITTSVAFFSFLSSDIGAVSGLGVLVGIGTIWGWFMCYFFLGGILSKVPNKKSADPLIEVHNDQSDIASSDSSSFIYRYTEKVFSLAPVIALVFVGLSAASVFVASKNEINANPFKYFAQGFWLRESNDFAEANLKGSQGMEIVVNSGTEDGIKSPEFLAKVENFQRWIDTTPGVVRTYSIIDIIKQSNRSLHADQQAFYKIPDSREAIAELIFLYSMNLPQGLDLSNRVSLNNDAMRISVRWTNYDSALATRYADEIVAYGQSLGLDVHSTGKMLLFQRMNGYVATSFVVTLLITVVIISILLLVTFKSVNLGWITLIANLFPLCLGMAVLYFTGNSIDIGAVIVLSVCLGVAVDDTIHFVSHAQKHLNQGRELKSVIRDTLLKVTPAITITTVILAIAFGSFITADFVPNANFGRMAATILSTAWLANVTLLPALLYLFLQNKQPALNSESTPTSEMS